MSEDSRNEPITDPVCGMLGILAGRNGGNYSAALPAMV